MYEDSTVIAQCRKLGYNANPRGICVGLTIEWIINALSEKEQNFYEPVGILTTTPDLAEKMQQVLRANGQNLTEYGQKIAALPDFITKTLLCQNPIDFFRSLGKCYPQLKLQPLLPYIETPEIRSQGGLVEIHSEPVIENEAGIFKYFEDVRQIIIDAQKLAKRPIPVALHVGSFDHSIGLKYQSHDDTWLMMHSGNMLAGKCKRPELAKKIMEVFREPGMSAFNVNVFITKNNIVPATWWPFSKSITEAFSAFRKKHIITAEIARRTTCHGVTLAYIAALDGHADIIQALALLKANLEVFTVRGSAPIHAAASMDKFQVISTFSKFHQNLNLYTKDGYAPIYIAASNGYEDTVKALAIAGANLSLPCPSGWQPIHISAACDYVSVMQVLAEHNAKLNVEENQGRQPAHLAAANNCVQAIHILAKHKAYLGRKKNEPSTAMPYTRPVHVATSNGHIEIIRALTQYQIDFNVPDIDGRTPVYIAAQQNNLQMLRALKEGGANLDQPYLDGNTATHIAAQKGFTNILKFLIANRVNLNAVNQNHQTPVYLAVQANQSAAIRLLYQAGANLNYIYDDDDKSLAHIAALNDADSTMQTLAECNANLNGLDQEGKSPAHIAVERQNIKMIKILTANHADFISVNPLQRSPLDHAIELKRWDIVIMILTSLNYNQLINENTLKKLNQHRSELTTTIISMIKAYNDQQQQLLHINNIIDQKHLLATILHKPTDAFSFFFTSNKFRDKKVTNSIYRIVTEFSYLFNQHVNYVYQQSSTVNTWVR